VEIQGLGYGDLLADDPKPKLSDLIRKGAKLRGKTRGYYFKNDLSGNLSSCALGAAFEGLTGRAEFNNTVVLATLSAGVGYAEFNTVMCCPVCAGNPSSTFLPGTLQGVITHLNDYEGWTREQIADWLQSIDM
jgi:hypothetical protein